MSLLDNAADVIVVHTTEETVDSYGNTVITPSDQGVELRCIVSPQSSSNDRSSSRVESIYKVMTSDVSTTRWIRVRYDDRWFSVVDWKRFNHSIPTRHTEALIREET
jgi:hypothetical protein